MRNRTVDPIIDAAEQATVLIQVHVMVSMARMDEPDAYPSYCIPMTWSAVANRIVGELLEDGWTPPSADLPAAP